MIPSPVTGQTKRVEVSGIDARTLTISSSVSKENAPYVTNRFVQRFDLSRVDLAGKKVTLSCYVVIAAPLSSLFTQTEVIMHVKNACLGAAFGQPDETGELVLLNHDHLTSILEGQA